MKGVDIHIEGIGDIINYTAKISKNLPITADDISRTLARDTQTRARQLLTQRLSKKRRSYGTPNITGNLANSSMVYQHVKGGGYSNLGVAQQRDMVCFRRWVET